VSRLAAAFRKAELDREAARKVREALEAGEEPPPNPRALAGDPIRLRGLPAVGGRGSVGGAIRGTRPDHEVIRRLDGGKRRRARAAPEA
jgi:hypothetical protein